jgi:hypothetical protein
VGTGNGDPEVPELPSVRRYSWAILYPGDINTEAWSSRLGVGREADNLTLYKEICWESSKGKKILAEAKAHLQGCGATDDEDDDDYYCCLNIWLVVLYLNV